MRFKQCDGEDIHFLKSLVAGSPSRRDHLSSSEFRHVSIITGLNSHRDAINSIGCKKFALDCSESLETFYSVDTVGDGDDVESGYRKKGRKRWLANIADSLKSVLWELPHYDSSNIPGVIHICRGMPVIIKKNLATECGVTNGGEGIVVDWISHNISSDRKTLDVVFIKLTNGSLDVQVENLPPNVVPVCAEEETIKCLLPDDTHISVRRKQVCILPNFAMTDYASQGKTRPVNVVDLHNLHSHQAYYTALSRGAHAAYTLIIQGFSASKIMGGLSSDLLSEFRDIEILDDITRLEYIGMLPATVMSTMRYSRIAQFIESQGLLYQPALMDDKLRWNPTYARSLSFRGASSNREVDVDMERNETDNARLLKHKPTTLKASRKRKPAISESIPRKRLKQANVILDATSSALGSRWDPVNWSCAYDALFTILYHMLDENIQFLDNFMQRASPFSRWLSLEFQRVKSNGTTMESARDTVRKRLYNFQPLLFPYGQVGTSVADLAMAVLNTNCEPWAAAVTCNRCGMATGWMDVGMSVVVLPAFSDLKMQLLSYIGMHVRSTDCCGSSTRSIHVASGPSVMVLTSSLVGQGFAPPLELLIGNNTWKLHGLIYYGHYHFVSRYIDNSGQIWYHDGMYNQGRACLEGSIVNLTGHSLNNMATNSCRYQLAMVIYMNNA
ncbi:hypothetical protein AURDEDRAFT_73413 [Auricularia subglabra TFB-10046 SS5]|nr:hypothetical protein AURDEDRAFT_73413 [Auricularia subglabra TFB-10046 SS5]